MASPHDMPSAVDASSCPSGTELMPARMISAMYADSLSANPIVANRNGMDKLCKLNSTKVGPVNGTPSWMCW